MSDDPKVLTRIQKLLALADTGTNQNEHEAQQALLRAQELMARHNISVENLQPLNEPTVETKTVYTSGRLDNWRKSFAAIIANNFRCKAWFVETPQGLEIRMMGTSTDLAYARKIYAQAFISCEAGASRYVKSVPLNHRKKLKNSYRTGFTATMEELFAKQVAVNGWELVVSAPPAVMNAFAAVGTEQVKPRVRNTLNPSAWHAGEKKAEEFVEKHKKTTVLRARSLKP